MWNIHNKSNANKVVWIITLHQWVQCVSLEVYDGIIWYALYYITMMSLWFQAIELSVYDVIIWYILHSKNGIYIKFVNLNSFTNPLRLSDTYMCQ